MQARQQHRAKRVLIGTVGGQGGGVLSDWLVRGLLLAGWRATGIGLLGLSQRAGTVTYYCEALPAGSPTPVTSMFAMPGDVDLLLGQELLELGRLLFGGFAAPEAWVIGNSSRYLSTLEKLPAEGGVYDPEMIAQAVRALAPGRHFVFDASRLVTEVGLSALTGNAMLLGAVVASPVFGLPREPFHAAIRGSEVNVRDSIAAFDLGYERMRDGSLPRMMIEGREPDDWRDLARQRAARLGSGVQREAYRELLESAAVRFPEAIMGVLAEALYRLTDFQDGGYAGDYLTRVIRMAETAGAGKEGKDTVLAYARHLANWMAYEDVARVAQLKTRPERFARIAHEFAIRGQHFLVTDYMVPDTEQLLGVLPRRLAGAIRRVGRACSARFDELKMPLRVRSSTVTGYATLRAVAALRRCRRSSARFNEEMSLIARWEAAVFGYLDKNASLSRLAADAALVVKGYGRVRRDALEDLWVFLDRVLPLLEAIGASGGDTDAVGRKALTLLAKQAGSAKSCLDFLELELAGAKAQPVQGVA